jgi:hypothetical protein
LSGHQVAGLGHRPVARLAALSMLRAFGIHCHCGAILLAQSGDDRLSLAARAMVFSVADEAVALLAEPIERRSRSILASSMISNPVIGRT